MSDQVDNSEDRFSYDVAEINPSQGYNFIDHSHAHV